MTLFVFADDDPGEPHLVSSAVMTPSPGQLILMEDDVLEYVIEENVLLRTLGYSLHHHCPEAAALILRWNLLRIFEMKHTRDMFLRLRNNGFKNLAPFFITGSRAIIPVLDLCLASHVRPEVV